MINPMGTLCDVGSINKVTDSAESHGFSMHRLPITAQITVDSNNQYIHHDVIGFYLRRISVIPAKNCICFIKEGYSLFCPTKSQNDNHGSIIKIKMRNAKEYVQNQLFFQCVVYLFCSK